MCTQLSYCNHFIIVWIWAHARRGKQLYISECTQSPALYGLLPWRCSQLFHCSERDVISFTIQPVLCSSYVHNAVQIYSLFIYLCVYLYCRPRWSRGNVLVSRSKVRGFKPVWSRLIFSGRTNPEHKSSEVWEFTLVKEPQAWKNRPLSKI